MPKFKHSTHKSNKQVNHFNGFKFKDESEKKPKLGILPEQIMSYYRQVSSTLENGFEEDDTIVKDDFLNNVYASLKDDGIQVSQNQTVSRILEALFVHSKPSHLTGFFIELSKELALVCFDRFASHVFQSLIRYLPLMFKASRESEEDTQDKIDLKLHIDRLCQFVESHMRDFMTHTYGSHILRSLLEALAGVTVKEQIVRSRLSRNQSYANAVPSIVMSKDLSIDYCTWFKTLKDKILKLCNYDDHLSDENYCPVLQTVMLILHKTSPEEFKELADDFFKKTCIVPEDFSADEDVFKRLPTIVQNEVGSYLFELLITLAAETELEQLYKDVFKQKMVYFAVHPIANFVLQKFLTVVKGPTMMTEVFDELSQYMEDVLAVNHIGVVTKLAEACRRNHKCEDKFLNVMMTAFHCHTPESRQLKIVPLIASLQTYEIFFKESEQTEQCDAPKPGGLLTSVTYHGSMLLQQLLQFGKTQEVVLSLLDLTGTELSSLCCDKFGSHVVEAFFQSETNKDKNKDDFLRKLQGSYINIACNRNGSRCLEGIWKLIALKQKIFVVQELLKSQERLEGDQFGRFLYHNFALAKFTERRREWEELQGVVTKKRQVLQDILKGTGGRKKKRGNQKINSATANGPSQSQDDVHLTDESQSGKKKKAPPAGSQIGEKREVAVGSTSDNVKQKKKKKKKKKAGKPGEEGITQKMDVERINQKIKTIRNFLHENAPGKGKETKVESENNFQASDPGAKTHKSAENIGKKTQRKRRRNEEEKMEENAKKKIKKKV